MNTSTNPAPSTVPDFVGSIDGVAGDMLSGWGVTIHGDPSEVRIIVNGQEMPVIVADQPRPDLQIAGQAKGLGGWRIDIGTALTDGDNRIEAIFPDRSPLNGSPLVFSGRTPAKPAPAPAEGTALRYVGAIDNQHPPSLSGWAVSSACKAVPVTIEIEGRAMIEIPSSDPRADLGNQGLSDGDGGWHYEIGAIGDAPMAVHIRFPDGTELPGSPLKYNQPAPEQLPAPETPEMAAEAAGTDIVPPPQPAPADLPPTPPVPEAPAPPPVAAAKQEAPPTAVTKLTPRPQSGPSLAELDEISLDDLAAAVEAGIIYVPPPPPPPPEPEVVQSEAEVEAKPQRKGFFARLLGR